MTGVFKSNQSMYTGETQTGRCLHTGGVVMQQKKN